MRCINCRTPAWLVGACRLLPAVLRCRHRSAHLVNGAQKVDLQPEHAAKSRTRSPITSRIERSCWTVQRRASAPRSRLRVQDSEVTVAAREQRTNSRPTAATGRVHEPAHVHPVASQISAHDAGKREDQDQHAPAPSARLPSDHGNCPRCPRMRHVRSGAGMVALPCASMEVRKALAKARDHGNRTCAMESYQVAHGHGGVNWCCNHRRGA
jgi:hypothetical protein